METNLYVGNLPPDATAEDLRAAFGHFGTVLHARVAIDRATGLGWGYGFVEMECGAGEAARALNGTTLRSHTLTVREATTAGA